MREERSHVSVPALRNAPQMSSLARGVLARSETEEARITAPGIEAAWIAHGGEHEPVGDAGLELPFRRASGIEDARRGRGRRRLPDEGRGAERADGDGKEEPSHVLSAMGYENVQAGRVLRFSSGWETTESDWMQLLEGVIQVSEELARVPG